MNSSAKAIGTNPDEVEALAKMAPAEITETADAVLNDELRSWITENIVSGSDLLATDPPPVDPILQGVFDTGDLFAIIAPSKCRKSFTALQLAISIASGLDFIGIPVAKQRRVLLVQFEVKESHYQRRVKKVCKGMESSFKAGGLPCLEDRLHIFNARGKDFDLNHIAEVVRELDIEVVIFDPLYKMMDGAENGAEDMKPIFSAFSRIMEETGAAVGYVHHDAKGNPGMRSTRDRGSGSGVIGRAYDACMTLTEHEEENHAVVELLLRNYPPQKAFTISWNMGAFHRSERPAMVKRNASPTANPTTSIPDEDFFPQVVKIMEESGEINSGELDRALRDVCGVTKEKAAVIRLAAIRDHVITAKTGFGKGKVHSLPATKKPTGNMEEHILPVEGKNPTGNMEGEKA